MLTLSSRWMTSVGRRDRRGEGARMSYVRLMLEQMLELVVAGRGELVLARLATSGPGWDAVLVGDRPAVPSCVPVALLHPVQHPVAEADREVVGLLESGPACCTRRG